MVVVVLVLLYLCFVFCGFGVVVVLNDACGFDVVVVLNDACGFDVVVIVAVDVRGAGGGSRCC